MTDDNSAISRTTFNTNVLALDAMFSGYRLNSIVATLEPIPVPPNICTGIAAARGTEYIELSGETGGIVTNLCEQNFTPAFSTMASAIVASFP